MKILHTSDIHGQTGIIIDALSDPCYDVWIDTGDFLPNQTRGLRSVETRYQTAWFAPEVTTHFFGHIHEAQGSVTELGVRFVNGAGKAIFHTLASV